MDRRTFTLACGAGLVTGPLAQPAPLLLHHIGPFTGVLAESNTEAINGARLYLRRINASGGLAGRPLELQTLDDGQDPRQTRALFDTLISQGQLLALLLPRTTPSMEALLDAVARHGVPVVGPQTGASFVNQPPRREIFTLRASYQREAAVAIRQQHSIGARSFGLLLADDSFGKDTMVGISSVMNELGIRPSVTSHIDNRRPDIAEALNQMLAVRPQVILLIVSGKAAAGFIRAYRDKGASATFVSLSNTSNGDYVKALGDQARGSIVMQVLPSPYAQTTALAREYGSDARAAAQPLSYAGLYGYATAKLLTLGLERAGRTPTRESLIAALEGAGRWDLGGFPVTYGQGRREGSGFVDSTIITRDGKFLG